MPLLEWPTQLGVIGRGEFRMKEETAEDMMEFAKEICQKYSRVKTLAEETQMQWRQDLERLRILNIRVKRICMTSRQKKILQGTQL